MTLLELLLVMMVLGVVLGAGVGMFATLDLGQRQARGLVKNVLRAAQNSATARQAPARVRFDRETNTMTAEALEVIGTWHFENRSLSGAGGLEGALVGNAAFEEQGFLGQAVAFDGKVGSLVEVPVQRDPAYDFRHGFSLECAMRREGGSGGRVVVISSVVCIDVTAAGAVRGWFIPRVVKEGREQAGGRVLVESEPGLAPVERWVRVRLEYDRSALALWINNVPVAAVPEDATVWKGDGPMEISGRRNPFEGSVDNLVIGAVVTSEVIEMPETVRFAADVPPEVVFAAGGGLDRRKHPEPLLITLEYDDGTSRGLLLGTYGTVDG